MIGRRVVFKNIGVVKVESFNVNMPSRRQVLIKTICSLISPGTETAFLLGLPNTPRKFPTKVGYSNIGRIIDVGEGVDKSLIGKIVASTTHHSTHVVENVDKIYPIPEELIPEKAAFFHLCAISLQGVRKGFIEIGNSIAVIGLGVIGQLALQFSRLNGGFPVIGIDLIDYRLKKALENGAEYVINPLKEDLFKRIDEITDGRGVDVVIEASGSPNAIEPALKIAGKRGRVVLLGSTRGLSTINFYSLIHRKGLMVIGAHTSIRPRVESYPHYWTKDDDINLSLKLLATGRINVENLITGRYSIEEAPLAYHELIENKDKHITILLEY